MNNGTDFSVNPIDIHTSRSRQNAKFTRSTTLSAGQLVPILNYELVMPGDSFKIAVSALIRSTTPLAPVMDDAYLDIYFFFAKHQDLLNRQSLDNTTGAAAAAHSFKAWIGAQDQLINMPYPEKHALPALRVPNGFLTHSIFDQLRYPLVSDKPYYVTPWSILSYISIWNNYFRDPNTMNPIGISVTTDAYSPTGYILNLVGVSPNVALLRETLYACRKHGYFGSCLPWPQRNSTSVELPLGDTASIYVQNNTGSVQQNGHLTVIGSGSSGSIPAGTSGQVTFNSGTSAGAISNMDVKVDLKNATAATVNQVRYAFAMQRYYEKLARGGNTLKDLTKALFGVTTHDQLDQVPEFLGGKSILLKNHLVANTAGTTYSTEEQQSIGSTGAFSLTNDQDHYVTKSFDTWGTLMAVCVVRPRESFSQGLDRAFTKFDPMQLYNPCFANIGEQPTYKKELFFANSPAVDDEVFGYQEAWAEYRHFFDSNTGELRAGKSLAYWSYVNNFSESPTLAGYLDGSKLYKNIDQTLQVDKATAGLQFMAQFTFDITMVRPMPTYSIPGLIDHN